MERTNRLAYQPGPQSLDGRGYRRVPIGGRHHGERCCQCRQGGFPRLVGDALCGTGRVMFKYRALIEQEFDSICQTISLEHGKTLAESRGELQRGLECVEYACGIPELLKGEYLENIARGIDCEVIRQPLGVCVGITPFNFPAMIAMWMFPLAISSGNTFIFKPSEKVPLTAIRLVQLLEEADFPKGLSILFTVVRIAWIRYLTIRMSKLFLLSAPPP